MSIVKSFPLDVEYKDFSLGLDNASAPGELDNRSLSDCLNFNITRKKKVQKRKGCTQYQSSACGSSAAINTIYEYKSPGGANVSTYVLAASGTKIYTYYNSTWNEPKTGLTSGLKHSFITHMGICYSVNGTDDNYKMFSDGTNVANITQYPLGIPAPTTDPDASAVSSKYTRRYVDASPTTGIFDFAVFSSKLMCIAANDIYSTSNGTTWAQEYDLTGGYAAADGDGKAVAVYASKFYWSEMSELNIDGWTCSSWDGTTTVANHLAGYVSGGFAGVLGFKVYMGNLHAWADNHASSYTAGNDTRGCDYYNGSSWTATDDFDGVTGLTYNTSSNHLELTVRQRTTQFFEFDGHLYLLASRYDGSNWEWLVYLYNEATGTSWNQIYAGAADGYVLSGVFELDGTCYVIGNTLSAGAGQDSARLYSSTDMINWTTEDDFSGLGFCFGITEADDEIFVLAQKTSNNYSLIWRFDEDNKNFIYDGIIDTNAGDGLKGGMYFWSNYLNVGGKDEIYTRDLTGITGKYYYKYTYKRNAWKAFEGNAGDASAIIDLYRQSATIDVTASGQGDVDKIVLYRTLADGETYYKHSEVANSTATITDTTLDADLTIELETDNDVPPKAKYLVLHKDRVVYLNCPDETDGASLVMWSKASKGEAVPALNFQYFDRDDGEEITGGASIGDALVVFKRNKILVITGDFSEQSELYSMQYQVGALSQWVILPFEDKVLFLSEEGWKAFDGRNIYSLSDSVEQWRKDKYFTTSEAGGYQTVYYPDREQFLTLMEHSSNSDIITVGHFLQPLLFAQMGSPEYGKGNIIGWTYHTYTNHTPTTLGTYTDSDNITRVLMGDSGGWIYELDDGTGDVDSSGTSQNIPYTFRTDWLDYGIGKNKYKVSRRCWLSYTSSTTDNMTFNIEKNFSDTDDIQTLACVTSGVGDADLKTIHLSGRGKVFRYTISSTGTKQDFGIMSITIGYRTEGIKR